MSAILSRTVLLLLLTRILLAPVALRPQANADSPSRGLTFRVCSWPAQQVRHSDAEVVRVDDAGTPRSLLGITSSWAVGAPEIVSTRPTLIFPLERYLRRALGQQRC